MAKRNRILLMNGCSISSPSVNPKNWLEGDPDLLQKDWRIQFYYHDPKFNLKWPNGKLCVIKGMNEFQNLEDRISITKSIIEDTIKDLRSGWNPVRKEYMKDENALRGELNPNLLFIDAFRIALSRLTLAKSTHLETKIVIDRLEKVARNLKMNHINIEVLKRRELKLLLNETFKTDVYFNRAKSYISSLFTELIDEDCCDVNLCRDIRKRIELETSRETLSPEHWNAVMNYLHSANYTFWRFSKIFTFSGSRTTELMKLQFKDVNIDQQEFTITVIKGKRKRRIIKAILPEVIPEWIEACEGAKPDDYIFSKGLRPGAKSIRRDQISRRWLTWVKNSNEITDKDGKSIRITADFYALKHFMLDSISEEDAQKLASHTSAKTTAIYRVSQEKRDRDELKSLRIVI
jgi:integrase